MNDDTELANRPQVIRSLSLKYKLKNDALYESPAPVGSTASVGTTSIFIGYSPFA